MDVGRSKNFVRILELFDKEFNQVKTNFRVIQLMMKKRLKPSKE